MTSLLQKLSHFDPETGGTFLVAGDNFLWKEGKKSPDDSKVTKLVKKYGWNLIDGNDESLLFKKFGDPGQLFVERGSKKWVYTEPNGFRMKSRGLERLYDALEKDVFGAFVKSGGAAATAVNNAGNGHGAVDGDPLEEIHIWGSKLLRREAMRPDYGSGFTAVMNDLNEQEEKVARTVVETLRDDSGARTGLRNRPDYGESDSYTSEMNRENSRTACLVIEEGGKTASGDPVVLYVTAVEFEKGQALRLAGFKYSADPVRAKVFLRRTAENLARQIRGLAKVTVKIAGPHDLLTTQNIKTQKKPRKELLTQHNEKTEKGRTKGFLTGVMHMMPSDLAGYGNVCPCASPECRQMCLNTAGVWANAPAIQNARRMKTELYFKNRPQFMADMRKSIQSLVRKADKQNLTPAVRINGTSDLPQVAMEMAKEFPQVQFYDYTKIPRPWERQLPNYHITFSRSEVNDKETTDALEHGVNVAVVFSTPKGEPLPKEWRGYKVVNGDEHDLRFLDKLEGEGPFVIGLRGKGKARGKDKGTESGFVVDPKSLVQIEPKANPLLQKKKEKDEEKPKGDLVQIGPKPPVSTQPDTVKERTSPATEDEGLEWDELEEKSASSQPPHNQWFIEGCFDDAHLHV